LSISLWHDGDDAGRKWRIYWLDGLSNLAHTARPPRGSAESGQRIKPARCHTGSSNSSGGIASLGGMLPGPEIEASVGGKATVGRTEIEISVGGKTGGKNENIGRKLLEKRDPMFIAITHHAEVAAPRLAAARVTRSVLI